MRFVFTINIDLALRLLAEKDFATTIVIELKILEALSAFTWRCCRQRAKRRLRHTRRHPFSPTRRLVSLTLLTFAFDFALDLAAAKTL